jgi:hypothetical protein
MSRNDWTGYESFTADELIGMADRTDDLTVELAKRLEDALDREAGREEILAALREYDVSPAEIRSIGDVIIDTGATTVALLKTLREFDIEDDETLRRLLENAEHLIAA